MNNAQKQTRFFIGHATDADVRYRASSGGIGTTVTRFLLERGAFGTALSFYFNRAIKMYEPKLIHSVKDLNVCGSIYQDINIVDFVKEHLSQITNGLIVSCPPCQVAAVRSILERAAVKSFVISFCCSGQTTIEGTWKYYDFIGVKKEDVVNMQYRGNGWPSGIQIELSDGKNIFHKNYTEPWATIHRSRLFSPKRCFYCTLDSSYDADLSLADSWLKEFIENDKQGSTLFFTNTESGHQVITEMAACSLIDYFETDYNSYYTAQQPNVEKRNTKRAQQRYIRREIKLTENRYVHRYFTCSLPRMRKYLKLRRYAMGFSISGKVNKMIQNFFRKVRHKVRYWSTVRKLGSHDGPFTLGKHVALNNPKHIHFGKGVGVGDNAFFLPVTAYQGRNYAPSIIIGEGTWVGKGCSIAAINRVEIGKHILFEGQVHITDHSHGYEDVTLPIVPQQLITKGPVVIEDDCWLGFSCEILSGVHIGKHCVVAARSVVTKDVPAYSIVAGNPAKVVKQYSFDTNKWETIRK